MATTYKVLGQSTPTANTITTMYTVPASTSAIVSTLSICNQSANSAIVGIAVCPGNTAVTSSQYIVKGSSVASGDTVFLTLGITLATTDTVRVEASVANVSFNAFGSELS